MNDELRRKMVERQIVDRGITDKRVIEAMKRVPRHEFLPQHCSSAAYEDHPLPIGHGQTISQPYIVALMTELCGLTGKEKVLEIGTGSGYQAAILSLLAGEVHTIEVVESLYKRTKKKLADKGYGNVFCYHRDGYRGVPEAAPFDAILLTAAPPKIPNSLVRQLSGEGGRLVAPVGTLTQELQVITKHGTNLESRRVTYVQFVPMVRGKTKG